VLRWIAANRKTEVGREELRRDALGQKLDAAATDTLLEGRQPAASSKAFIIFWSGSIPTTTIFGSSSIFWAPALLAPATAAALPSPAMNARRLMPSSQQRG
jgi:hypothetical protein